jgi:hypothetical protein
MHFKNGDVTPGAAHEEWHHNGIYSLVEFSAPVDLASLCSGSKWAEVTTKVTFLNGLVGSVDNILPIPVDLWSPQDVEWACGEGAEDNTAGPIRPKDPANSAK